MSKTHDKIDAWLAAADELLALFAEQPAGEPADDEPEAA